MPVSSFVIPLFVMFGGGTVGARGKLVLLGGPAVFVVCVVNGVSPVEGQQFLLSFAWDRKGSPPRHDNLPFLPIEYRDKNVNITSKINFNELG